MTFSHSIIRDRAALAGERNEPGAKVHVGLAVPASHAQRSGRTMRPVHRRILGLLATACVLVGAGLATIRLEERGQQAGPDARGASWRARRSPGPAESLASRLRAVEARAAAGASLNPVRALVAEHVDTATLQDAFGTESWWKAFRDEFTVHALIEGRAALRLHAGWGLPSGGSLALLAPRRATRWPRACCSREECRTWPPRRRWRCLPSAVAGRPLLVLARPLTARSWRRIAQESRTSLVLVDAKGGPWPSGGRGLAGAASPARGRARPSPSPGESGPWRGPRWGRACSSGPGWTPARRRRRLRGDSAGADGARVAHRPAGLGHRALARAARPAGEGHGGAARPDDAAARRGGGPARAPVRSLRCRPSG